MEVTKTKKILSKETSQKRSSSISIFLKIKRKSQLGNILGPIFLVFIEEYEHSAHLSFAHLSTLLQVFLWLVVSSGRYNGLLACQQSPSKNNHIYLTVGFVCIKNWHYFRKQKVTSQACQFSERASHISVVQQKIRLFTSPINWTTVSQFLSLHTSGKVSADFI